MLEDDPWPNSLRIDRRGSTSSSAVIGEGIVIDLGTGDGLCVREAARRNRTSSTSASTPIPGLWRRYRREIHRKPSKGGLRMWRSCRPPSRIFRPIGRRRG